SPGGRAFSARPPQPPGSESTGASEHPGANGGLRHSARRHPSAPDRRQAPAAAAPPAGLGCRPCRARRATRKRPMTPTAFAFVYRPGPAWIRDCPLAEQKLGPHAPYMGELFARGRLLLGGPFLDTGGGFALVAADTEEEAREIFERDPAIVDG